MIACALVTGAGCAANHNVNAADTWPAQVTPILRAGPDAGHGTASLSGVACIEHAGGWSFNAAGRVVELWPVTPESTALLARLDAGATKQRSRSDDPLHLFHSDAGFETPDALARRAFRTLGYGHGQFEFTDLPPGDYYVVFRETSPVTTPGWTAHARVSIADAQHASTDARLQVPADR